ncbi:RecBCD enzyme subunit RecB [Serratia symbiotica]|nr:RecBCD enzyme subunit RecB [Serratia symbiotica]
MTEKIPQRLNPLTLPLFGERLIEASAGTGKTFTIGTLYLRLLLGLGKDSAFHRPLSIEEILVVTFTEVATEELRARIRKNIRKMRLVCMLGKSEEPLFSALLDEIDDLPYAAAKLLTAERHIDEAAIYTIHGFCHRALTHNALESGMLFEQILVQDELPLRRQACADFWRRHCYPLPLDIARLVSQEWAGPDELLADLYHCLHGEEPALRNPPQNEETVLMRHEAILARINNIKAYWKKVAGDLETLIRKSGADKRSYNSKRLQNWLSKVGEWTMKETSDYQLPKELGKFRQSILLKKTIQGEAPRHPLFTAIDELFAAPLSIRDLIIARALSEIRRLIHQEKRRRAELGFDDLLSQMDSALQSVWGEQLACSIRERYPVAIIDEFQDTDPQQYRIFHKLYIGHQDCGLLLIGDPKQAIYSFRGADIFTYMRARAEISAHYCLGENWRSSHEMVASVNTLFCQLEKPFLFSQIPFIGVSAAPKNKGLVFELNNQSQPAMQFWLQQGESVCVSDYQQLMARVCATQIRDWLIAGKKGQAWLDTGTCRRPVQPSNITILVRTHNEAGLVRDALSALLIPSVYLSNRDSVFDTLEAKELLWLLRGVLVPEQSVRLRTAIATSLMGLDAWTLASFSSDELAWGELLDEFYNYRRLWLRRGVLPMLRQVMKTRCLAENLLATPGGERRLANLLHLGEILQEAATQLNNEHALVRWLAQQISQPNRYSNNQQLRLESDSHLVQVITIHKSKGLEFDLVWLPFLSKFRKNKALYHDRHSFQAILDLNVNADSLAWSEEERLAEDLRLLYVALTRSIYHTSIGIAPLIQGARKKQLGTDLHRSALGYLVQAGKEGDAAYLHASLQQLGNDGIVFSDVGALNEQPWQPAAAISKKLAAKVLSRHIEDVWRVTSYTSLRQHNLNLMQDLVPNLDIAATEKKAEKEAILLTPHTFPRGAVAGIFLHSLLEALDFSRLADAQWLLKLLQQQGFPDSWQPGLLAWLQTVFTTPLNDNGLILAALPSHHKKVELHFYLLINRMLQARELDELVKRYDPISARCPPLDFKQVKGMLNGFIDLVFCWQGKYYLLDYKSNWLGEDSSAYTQVVLERAMAEHRYDLQYQLYTLALHRYLRHRLPDYDYQRYFGGVIYLFVRGVDVLYPGNGVYSCRPSQALVEGMNFLFSGGTDVENGK